MNRTVTCPGCGQTLDLSPTVKTVACPFCDEVFENEYYSETATDEQGPVFGDVCLKALVARFDRLKEIESEALQYGEPILDLTEETKTLLNEAGLDVSSEDVFLLWQDGESFFALCASGMICLDMDGHSDMVKWEYLSECKPRFYDGDGVLVVEDAAFACGEIGEGLCTCLTDLFASLSCAWERALYAEFGMDRYAWELLDRMMSRVEFDPANFGGTNALQMNGSSRAALNEWFGLGEEDAVCFYYDTNPLRPGKEGFAMTEHGVRFRNAKEDHSMTWDAFARAEIVHKKPAIFGVIGAGRVSFGEIALPYSAANRTLAHLILKHHAQIREAMGEDAVQNA